MPLIDPDKIANYILEVAADKIIPRFRQLEKHEISTKSGPTDLVTIADIEAEEDLTRIFKDIIPGSYVVGEEAVSKKQIDMSLLKKEQGYVWVIDPVDGTNNFAGGNEKFGTIIALVYKGETIQGWICDIPGNRMAIAEQGGGVQVSGKKALFPHATTPLNKTRGFISRKFLPPRMREELKPIFESDFGNVETYMCCAHEYLDILAGEAFFCMYSRIRPWDHLAGGMMMAEVGGYVRKWDRTPYGPGDERGGLIVTQDEAIWDQIYDLLIRRYVEEKHISFS